ncbi:AAEL008587-PA [Aedes aegypti]|uniref:Glutamate [NMDA] receptor subunit 1 n=2 Tax=Aedes aegypti TaxID=7159 RepID=Q16YE2_AEDAE|nr:glutamate [NMDA] receptor subunit 1 [Aedes aegypti]XP_021705514.1 glutamate [NMDA] receptor subunit 1 [Aedes aegypti]EAT39625.1 AAEL008587-PA [Aedes aegypti]
MERKVLSLLCLFFINVSAQRPGGDYPSFFNIGGVLSNNDSETHFSLVIAHLNFDQTYVPRGVTYYDKTIRIDKNPIKTALDVCKHLISRRVYAVVVSHEPTGDLSPAAVSYTNGFYQIPIIGISSRDAAFSDKNIHVSFLRTVPPFYHQADVWLEMLSHFGYTKVIVIHSSDTDGRAILGRFQTTSQTNYDDIDVRATVESIIEFEPKLETFTENLMEMKTAQSRVYLLYASTEDSYVIFRDAAQNNMTETGHIWIVTEQALQANNTPIGVLGLKLNNSNSENEHIKDAIYVLASAIKEMITHNETITEAPKDCDDTGAVWESGKKMFNYLKTRHIKGETGHVAFDSNGDRIYAAYEVINVQQPMLSSTRKNVKVGSFFYDEEKGRMRLKINDTMLVWPGNTEKKPEGIMIPTHLKVLTIEEKPFVYVRKLLDDEIDCEDDEIACPHFNSTDGNEKDYCCKGYCIDLLKALAQRINFTYDLALSPDGQFGHYQLKNHTTGIGTSVKKEWNGLIGELVAERADLIVAPLTINPERAEFIEFSKPFKYQGITILEKKPSRSSTLVSFLQPFSNTLWILVMVSVHVVALVLYLLDRFSPFGRFKLTTNDGTEEDALNLSSAIWFAWGVLLNSGIGEGTPRSFSARVLGMVWAGFAMIIVASYTANLAAFLVLERPKTKLSGINDARLRNTMENLTCATVKGSAVDMYFRRQVELSNMYRTMEANNYDTAEQAIQDVKDGKLMAFIWDSSRLEYEAAKDCELVTAGELFGRSGYGIGLQKGSPWTDAVTLAILDFHESGFMESLDKEWIFHGNIQQCEQFEKTPNTLGLKNMAGVFILVGAGIVGGIGLIIIEVIYKKHQIKKQKKLEIARHAADKWRGTIEKRKTLRASLAMQRQYNVGLNSVSKSISQAVDKNRNPKLNPLSRAPERAWPGDHEIARNRRNNDQTYKPPPRYMPTYATDVSHLVV